MGGVISVLRIFSKSSQCPLRFHPNQRRMSLAPFSGSWSFDRSDDKVNAYLEYVGVSMMNRTLMGTVKPYAIFSQEGDTIVMQSKSRVKNTETKFKIGQEYEELRADGKKFMTIYSWDSQVEASAEECGEEGRGD